jgi:hypothetical protein
MALHCIQAGDRPALQITSDGSSELADSAHYSDKKLFTIRTQFASRSHRMGLIPMRITPFRD